MEDMLVLYLICLVVCLLCAIPALMNVNNHNFRWITYGEIIIYVLISLIPFANILFALGTVSVALMEGIHWVGVFYDNSEFMNKEAFRKKEK